MAAITVKNAAYEVGPVTCTAVLSDRPVVVEAISRNWATVRFADGSLTVVMTDALHSVR